MSSSRIQLSRKIETVEWPQSLTVENLNTYGWQPMSFNQFILKVHSRCNLACDYCYIYEMSDDSWKAQPSSMSMAVAEKTAKRIADHVKHHSINAISIVLHGGEPLLMGERKLRQLLEVFEENLIEFCAPVYGVQTNGIPLTPSMLSLFDEFNVMVGISLDGGQIANDKHRSKRNGDGSFDLVVERLNVLMASSHRLLYRGILATIDVENDPIETYLDLRKLNPPGLDFMLPHGNWTQLPPLFDLESSQTVYADWLIKIFDHWFCSEKKEPRIRIFEEIIDLLQGMPGRFESLGLTPVRLATIQADGSFELVDTLKSAFDGAAETGMNVFEHDFDQLAAHPSVAARQIGRNALSDTCNSCEVVNVCGGGYYPHRYRQGTGFKNPSVFCKDLLKLIKHIQTSLTWP